MHQGPGFFSEGLCFLARCRSDPAPRFCFSPAPGGVSPREAVVIITEEDYIMAATKGKKKGLGRWIQEHLMQVLVLLLAVALGFLAVRIQMYQASAEEMQTQISQKDEQLERQGLLINEWKGKNETENTSESIPVVTSSTIKTQLSSLQELVTQEYVYTNADKRESTEKWIFGWERPFSGKSILITYDGTIKAGIDLNS